LSNMSHEIRTPLNAIIGFAEILSTSKLEKKQQEQINYINQSSKNLLGLINDILDLSKMEAGEFKLSKIPFSLRNKLKEVEIAIDSIAKNESVTITYKVSEDVHDVVFHDPLRFYQVLLNLLSNAVKFTKKGFITCHISV